MIELLYCCYGGIERWTKELTCLIFMSFLRSLFGIHRGKIRPKAYS